MTQWDSGQDQPDEPGPRWAASGQGWDQPPITEITEPGQPWQSWQREPTSQDDGLSAGYPQAGYQPIDYPAPGYPQAAPAGRSKLRWILGSVLAVLLVAVSGVAFAAYQTLNGGGTQPDEVVPASAVAFAKLDLNPSASQKIAAAQFLSRIPKLNTGFSSTGDWRKPLFDALSRAGALPPGVNFDQDIKPWLGRRMGLAVLPTKTDGAPDLVLAIQSTDDAKARAGIASFGSDYGMNFYKGYAIIARDVLVADRAISAAKATPLRDSTRYHADLAQLGGLGVATGWVDLAGVGTLVGPHASDLGLTGRLAYTMRFSGKAVELLGKSFGQQSSVPSRPAGAIGLADLPASTAVGIQSTGLAGRLDQSWTNLQTQLGALTGPAGEPVDPLLSWQQQFGLNLPADLDTLLGTSQLLALDSDGLGGADIPKLGVRTWTDGSAAVHVLDKLAAGFGPSFPVTYRATSDGVVAVTEDSYLAKLTSPSGPRLSSVAGFAEALPDLSGAPIAAYLNLDAIGSAIREHGGDAEMLRQLAPFRALGLTVKQAGDVSTMRIRLIER